MADSASDTKISEALSERLRTQLGGAYVIQFELAPAKLPPADEVYLAEAYIPARKTPVGLPFQGSEDNRGLYQVMVLAPRDKYKAMLNDAIKAVMDSFPRGLRIAADGISVLVTNVYRGGEPVSGGSRAAVPVTIEWRAFS